MKDLLKDHVSFEPVSKLEVLAREYNISIVFCPKYHCELNPFEGLWCEQKRQVRKQNDQDTNKLFSLIEQSRDDFRKSDKNLYLWRRFWNSIEMYSNGGTYQDVLKTFFGVRSSARVKNKKKINDFNSLLLIN